MRALGPASCLLGEPVQQPTEAAGMHPDELLEGVVGELEVRHCLAAGLHLPTAKCNKHLYISTLYI